jgi:hypothetical protein
VTRLQHVRVHRSGSVRRPWAARLLALGAALLATLALAVAGPGAAWAADQPDSLTIGSADLKKPISVRATGDLDLFNALLRQVDWMAGQAGDPIRPDPTKLGPKYTLTVFVKNAAAQVYDLYPQAPGGPRAHRPAAQPHSRTTEAWFYASVAMPDTLQAAGVPLPQPTTSSAAGQLTYEDPIGYVPAAATTGPDLLSLGKTLHEQTRTLLLWLLTPLVILLLLFAAARRSRRYAPR